LPSSRRPPAAVAALATLAAGLALAAPAAAYNYVPGAGGITWGVHDVAAPALDTGSIRDVVGSDALIGFGGIRVRVAQSPEPRFNGELMRGFGLRFDGWQEFKTTHAVDLGGIEIARAIHVERAADWTRWVDSFTNTTNSTQTVEVVFGGQTGTRSPAARPRRRATPDGSRRSPRRAAATER
jgi:amidase